MSISIRAARKLAKREFMRALAEHGIQMGWRRRLADRPERVSDIEKAYGRPDVSQGSAADIDNPEIYEDVEGGIQIWIPAFKPTVEGWDALLQTTGEVQGKASLDSKIDKDDVLIWNGSPLYVDQVDVPSAAICKDLTLRRAK